LRAGQRRTGVVGHRGSRATDAENTLASFRHAIEFGADAVELDIVVTTDGQLAVTHDPVDAAFPDLPPGVPKLEDVLALADGSKIVFDIEMKECGKLTPADGDYAQMLIDRIDSPALRGRIMARSFEHGLLRAVHALRPHLPMVALVENNDRDWLDVCAAASAVCISPRFEHVTQEAAAKAHASRIAVIPWTANDPSDWARLIGMGVNAIVTDDPAALARFIEQGSTEPNQCSSAP
jgi:glycerophosphoryl diester phosphodiesterase